MNVLDVTDNVLQEIRGGFIDGRDALTDNGVKKTLKNQAFHEKKCSKIFLHRGIVKMIKLKL